MRKASVVFVLLFVMPEHRTSQVSSAAVSSTGRQGWLLDGCDKKTRHPLLFCMPQHLNIGKSVKFLGCTTRPAPFYRTCMMCKAGERNEDVSSRSDTNKQPLSQWISELEKDFGVVSRKWAPLESNWQQERSNKLVNTSLTSKVTDLSVDRNSSQDARSTPIQPQGSGTMSRTPGGWQVVRQREGSESSDGEVGESARMQGAYDTSMLRDLTKFRQVNTNRFLCIAARLQ